MANSFLGRLTGETARFSVSGLGRHTRVHVRGTLVALNRWTGQALTVTAPGSPTPARQTSPIDTTASGRKLDDVSFGGSTSSTSSSSPSLGGDDTYYFDYEFLHSGPSAQVDFAVPGLSGSQQWGLDDVRVWVDGAPLVDLDALDVNPPADENENNPVWDEREPDRPHSYEDQIEDDT